MRFAANVEEISVALAGIKEFVALGDREGSIMLVGCPTLELSLD